MKRERIDELKLSPSLSTFEGIHAIKACIGEPPFTGAKRLTKATRIAIVDWRRDHTGITARALAKRLGVPFHTYKNWQQCAAGSQGGSPTGRRARREAGRGERLSKAEQLPVTNAISEKVKSVRKLAAKIRHQRDAARSKRARPLQGAVLRSAGGPVLWLSNGARVTGLSQTQLLELLSGLTRPAS